MRVVVVASTLLVLLLGASRALAENTPGSQYKLAFKGTASADNSDGTDDESGSWTVEDDAANLWLPAAAGSVDEGTSTGSSTESPFEAGTADDIDDPAELTWSYVAGNPPETTTCSAAWLYDRGEAFITADVTPGQLLITTDYNTIDRRVFTNTAPNGDEIHWTCMPGDASRVSASGFVGYPPAAHGSTASGGTIAYGAAVPFADVGKAGFTVPVTDQSTINQAPWWADAHFATHHFAITGSYTFTKTCDGTIAYEEGAFAGGTCGTGSGGGGSGGGGSGGSGGGSSGGSGGSSTSTSTRLRHSKVTLPARAKLGSLTSTKLHKSGLVLGITSAPRAKVVATLVLAGKLAKHLKLSHGKSVVVAGDRAKTSAKGKARLRLKLRRRAFAKLRHDKRSYKVKLVLKITDGKLRPFTAHRTVTVHKHG